MRGGRLQFHSSEKIMVFRSGIKQEYRVKKHLEAQGWLVTRSAGSHGYADLIAIHREKKQIRFIQLKYGSEKYLKYGNKDKNDYSWINNVFLASFELMKLRKHDQIIDNRSYFGLLL